MFIQDHPGLTQQQIASNMTIDASLLAKDIKLLIDKGWVKRQVNQQDRRAKVITLTATGTELAQKLQKTMTNWWADLFKNNPEIDSDILGHQLELVRRALEERKKMIKKWGTISTIKHFVCLILGIGLMSASVALSKIALLGTSPISSIPNVLSELTPLTIGQWTILFMIVLIGLEWIALRQYFSWLNVIQIIPSLFFLEL